MATLATLIDSHGVEVLAHLDRQMDVPVSFGLQRQGDVLVKPSPGLGAARTPIPAGGVPVVRGEAGGNTHTLVGAGFCDTRAASAADLTLAVLTVPDGSEAFLAHPEHGYLGIGPGTYLVRRQRQQLDEIAMVAD